MAKNKNLKIRRLLLFLNTYLPKVLKLNNIPMSVATKTALE